MANRRMINKSISVSEQVNELSDFSALLFSWLIPHADDYGVIPGSARKIKALVVPMRKQNTDQVETALKEIQAAGLIWRYVYKESEYIQFCKFDQHQDGLHKRTASKNPLYLEVIGDSENFREIPGNSHLIEPKGTKEKRKEPNEKIPGNDVGNPLLTEAIKNFTEMRKSIKKPMTDKALGMMLAKLETIAKTDEEKAAVLNQSTMNCWLTVYPLKDIDGQHNDKSPPVNYDLVWNNVKSQLNPYQTPEWVDPIIAAAVKQVGYSKLCEMDEQYAKRVFISAYKNALKEVG